MTATAAPRTLLGPRERLVRPADVASRSALMGNQRRRARRARRASRSLRALGRALAAGAIAAGLAVAAIVAADWVHRTPLLAVRTVEVEGLQRLDEAAVRAAAGIPPGVNLLVLDAAAVEARLAGLPGIRRAHVVRHLPDRVTVAVEEREPYALVNADGLHWVDAEGYLVGAASRPGAPTSPILTGLDPAAGPASDRLRAGLALLRDLEDAPARLAARVSEIDLSAPHGPVLYLLDAVEVRLGSSPWADRLSRLHGVLAELDARGERVASIDLRFRDLVVLTPRPAPGAGGAARAPGGDGRRRPAAMADTSATPAATGLERR